MPDDHRHRLSLIYGNIRLEFLLSNVASAEYPLRADFDSLVSDLGFFCNYVDVAALEIWK